MRIDTLIALALCCLALSGCTEDSTPIRSQVSERPTGFSAPLVTTMGQSKLGLRLRFKFEDLASILAAEVPETEIGTGRKRVCKRVIGIKVCGTANWQYTVTRTDDFIVSGRVDTVYFKVPLRFDGTAGVDGDAAKALGLNDVDFHGAVDATIGLRLDLDDRWCPVVNSDIQYRWTESPKVRWAGGIDIGIQSKLDETIAEQLADIDEKIKSSIDCDAFRRQISEHWRVHSFPLELPTSPPSDVVSTQSNDSASSASPADADSDSNKALLFLNLRPQSMKFSGVRTEADRVGVSFILESETSVDADAVTDLPGELPALQRTDYAVGQTKFEIPIRLPYGYLERYARDEVVGRTFTSNQSSSDLAVTVNEIEFFSSEEGLTIGLTFDADLPATTRNTIGQLYLTTVPVIDTFNRTLTLSDTSLSPVLDSAVWQLLTSIFENQIIRAIEKKTVIELGQQLDDLESKLAAQLSSPERTGGLLVTAERPSIQLIAMVPQDDALVIRVEFSTELDIDVPADVFERSR